MNKFAVNLNCIPNVNKICSWVVYAEVSEEINSRSLVVPFATSRSRSRRWVTSLMLLDMALPNSFCLLFIHSLTPFHYELSHTLE